MLIDICQFPNNKENRSIPISAKFRPTQTGIYFPGRYDAIDIREIYSVARLNMQAPTAEALCKFKLGIQIVHGVRSSNPQADYKRFGGPIKIISVLCHSSCGDNDFGFIFKLVSSPKISAGDLSVYLLIDNEKLLGSSESFAFVSRKWRSGDSVLFSDRRATKLSKNCCRQFCKAVCWSSGIDKRS